MKTEHQQTLDSLDKHFRETPQEELEKLFRKFDNSSTFRREFEALLKTEDCDIILWELE